MVENFAAAQRYSPKHPFSAIKCERGKTRNLCGINFTRRDCVKDRFSSSGQPTASAQRVNY